MPSVDVYLQEFEDVFSRDVPSILPPLKGIEHQIDLYPGLRILIDQLIKAISIR
jgi:hypothetical protein